MQQINLFDQISKNKRNSLLLIFLVFFVLFSLIFTISFIFYPEYLLLILIVSFIVSTSYIYSTYKYGDKIVLSSTGAKPINESDPNYAHLVNVVEGLSIAAGIPKPKIYIIDSPEINAYATGRDPKNASIAITTGALEKLKRDEIEGVIGHEISHIKNYDIRFAMIVAAVVGLVAIMSHVFLRSFIYGRKRDGGKAGIFILIGILLAIISPIIVRLVQLAISRQREYLADASSAQLTRYPYGLANALEKIKEYNQGKIQVSEAVSHLFFVDPNKSGLDNLFATHPPIDKRIEILRSM